MNCRVDFEHLQNFGRTFGEYRERLAKDNVWGDLEDVWRRFGDFHRLSFVNVA